MSIVLYLMIGACWLPVVWLQLRVRDLAVAAHEGRTALDPRAERYMRCWYALGWPAFLGVIVIFALMVAKPALW